MATLASVTAVLWTLTTVIVAALSYSGAKAIAAAGNDPMSSPITAYDIASMVNFLFLLMAAICGASWLSRARKNAEVLAPQVGHDRSRAWVWLGWFVPIVSFWFPFQVVRDVGRAAYAQLGAVLNLWWSMWLLSLVLSNVANRLEGGFTGGPNLATLQAKTYVSCAWAAAFLVACMFWLLTITGSPPPSGLRLGRQRHGSECCW